VIADVKAAPFLGQEPQHGHHVSAHGVTSNRKLASIEPKLAATLGRLTILIGEVAS
jgi:hypothetical protein